MNKTIIFIVAFFFIFPAHVSCIAADDIFDIKSQDEFSIFPLNNPSLYQVFNTDVHDIRLMKNAPSMIDNYTWAVMRYDHLTNSDNYGVVYLPTPSVGTILIPTNMMTIDVIKAALEISKESKIDTLHAFDKFVSKEMLHTQSAFNSKKDEWHTETCYNFRKESAVEMNVLGDICLRAGLVGECYAQASYNTAVLRLCGFSPEEVFTVGIQSYQGGHAVNIVKIKDQWYVLDSTYAPMVRMGMRDSIIFEKYFSPPITDYLVQIENDKYLINFGNLYPQYIPTLADPYRNMDAEQLRTIINEVLPLFNNSNLGRLGWTMDAFIENSTENPWMNNAEIPYNVYNAVGSTLEQKAQYLSDLIKDFIKGQSKTTNQNQYDKSMYASGSLSVDYPQVYANAAKRAAWTSWNAMKHDYQHPFFDVIMLSLRVKTTFFNKQIVEEYCVAYSDLLYLRHAGSSLDKAVLAYGTLRNMYKDENFWNPEDLFVIVDEDNNGYLAVRISDDWKFLSFDNGRMISESIPTDIVMVFNENDYFNSWAGI